MCKHCEKLQEPDKDLVHRFMARTATLITRKFTQNGNFLPVTADDLQIDVKVSATYRGVYNLLSEMWD